MSLGTASKTTAGAPRNYTLCSVCNLKGKKGNRLIACVACSLQVHWHCLSASTDTGTHADQEESVVRRVCNIANANLQLPHQ